MNTANKVTMLRILLVPIYMALFMIDSFGCQTAALAVFVIAAATDGVDGHIARKYNQITTFGKFVDPLADKMLITAAFLVMMHYGMITVWPVMIMLAREFVVAGIRLSAVSGGKVIAASWWGKVKTVTQIAAVIISMLLFILSYKSVVPMRAVVLVSEITVWISTVFTIASGWDYVAKNIGLLQMK